MTKPDPDKLKGPGGLTLRQIHEQVKQSTARDRSERLQKKVRADKQPQSLAAVCPLCMG